MTASNVPTILRAAPYLPVRDVATTGAYYAATYGFILEYAGGSPPEFAIYSRDGWPLMFRRVSDPARIRPNEMQGGTWDVFFWVTDLMPLFEEVQRRGAIIVYPPTVQPYGMKEFATRDPDGHVLGFGQEWP